MEFPLGNSVVMNYTRCWVLVLFLRKLILIPQYFQFRLSEQLLNLLNSERVISHIQFVFFLFRFQFWNFKFEMPAALAAHLLRHSEFLVPWSIFKNESGLNRQQALITATLLRQRGVGRGTSQTYRLSREEGRSLSDGEERLVQYGGISLSWYSQKAG